MTHLRILEGLRTYDLGSLRYVGRAADGAFVLSGAEKNNGLYIWRQGRLQPWVSLPSGWKAVATDGQGGVLARIGSNDSWTLGLLRGSTFRPLRFDRLNSLQKQGWSDVRRISAEGKIEIPAYFGENAKLYTVVLGPR